MGKCSGNFASFGRTYRTYTLIKVLVQSGSSNYKRYNCLLLANNAGGVVRTSPSSHNFSKVQNFGKVRMKKIKKRRSRYLNCFSQLQPTSAPITHLKKERTIQNYRIITTRKHNRSYIYNFLTCFRYLN